MLVISIKYSLIIKKKVGVINAKIKTHRVFLMLCHIVVCLMLAFLGTNIASFSRYKYM